MAAKRRKVRDKRDAWGHLTGHPGLPDLRHQRKTPTRRGAWWLFPDGPDMRRAESTGEM